LADRAHRVIASVMIPLRQAVALCLSADHGAARSLGGSREAHPAVSNGRVSLALVDARRIRRHIHRCADQLQPLMFVEPGPGVVFFARWLF